jgi:hypothetical protein
MHCLLARLFVAYGAKNLVSVLGEEVAFHEQ